MTYQFKITGIDNNKNKHIWLNYKPENIENLKTNEYIRFISTENIKEECNHCNEKPTLLHTTKSIDIDKIKQILKNKNSIKIEPLIEPENIIKINNEDIKPTKEIPFTNKLIINTDCKHNIEITKVKKIGGKQENKLRIVIKGPTITNKSSKKTLYSDTINNSIKYLCEFLNINETSLNYEETSKESKTSEENEISETSKTSEENEISETSETSEENKVIDENETNKEKQKEIFTEDQQKLVKYIEDNIDKNDILTITGIAGAGKTYTILKMFEKMESKIKNKSICFCGPTNMVVQRCKKYEKSLKKYFKTVEFMTISKLLNEKLRYNVSGKQYFKIHPSKKNPIFNFDIIIIDEISMVKSDHINYIDKNKKNIGLCIYIGDRNQLNPVKSNELDIFDKSIVNLTENIRCNNKEINIINQFLIQEINKYTSTYDFNNFIIEFYKLLFKFKNNKNVFIIDNIDDLISIYTDIYGTENSIIGNFTNNECQNINGKIKSHLVKTKNIKCIGDYFIGQQLVFIEPYENWNTSEFATIKDITQEKYKFDKIKSNNLIKFNKDFRKISISTENVTQYCKTFTEDDDPKLLKSQEIFNYLLHITNTSIQYKEVLVKLNSFDKVKINLIKLNNNTTIKTLVNSYKEDYEEYINNVKYDIDLLVKNIQNQYSKLYNEFIIEGLWGILNKYRIEVFAKIDSAFACTVHRLQGCSIDNIFVNMIDIFTLTDDNKNKLKCLYTCFSRCSKKLFIYTCYNPICKCNKFTTRMYDEESEEYYCLCNKCGYLSHNYKKCLTCKKIFYETMIYNNICFDCCKEI